MTRNETLLEISSNAFTELCQIADDCKGSWKPIYGEGHQEKWWLILYPAIHVAMGREFNTGCCSGLSFPTCDISQLPINMGSKFVFPTREAVVDFGNQTKELWTLFLYPELSFIRKKVVRRRTR